MKTSGTHKGFFKPKNPSKYVGDPTKIVFRSSWELKCMEFFDNSKDVISWQSEERAIAYRSPVDNSIHRYFPDFVIRVKTKDGAVETRMIEVKPKSQTIPPKKKANQKGFLKEVMTYGVNSAKWKAAKYFCDKRGWKFVILTEDQIFGPKYTPK
jgi:hypothetical protein